MTQFKALIIPADADLPLIEGVYDDNDMDSLAKLVFGADDAAGNYVGVSTMRQSGVQFVYDDNGLIRSDALPIMNIRAMKVWAHLAHRRVNEFPSPLVGTYVVIGLDSGSGESMDVPQVVRDYFAEEVVVTG